MGEKVTKAYYYLHTNGDIIYKAPFPVEADSRGAYGYFESDFVQDWWKINSPADFVRMIATLRHWCDSGDRNVDETQLIALEGKIGIKSFMDELEAL